MRITEEQELILGSLQCERLSSNIDNFRLVDDFYKGRNPSIVDTLQNEAYEDDANHHSPLAVPSRWLLQPQLSR